MAADVEQVHAWGKLISQIWEDPNSNASISIDARVLLVGPGVSKKIIEPRGMAFPMDIASIYLASYLSRGNGNLTVLDLPPGNISGCWKNWMAVRNIFDFLAKKGARFCPYNFTEGDVYCQNLFPPGAFDVVIDHFTWHWHNPGLVAPKLDALIRQYSRWLGDNGKAFLFDLYRGIHVTAAEIIARRAGEIGNSASVWSEFVDRYPLRDRVILDYVMHDDILRPDIKENGEMQPEYRCMLFTLIGKRHQEPTIAEIKR